MIAVRATRSRMIARSRSATADVVRSICLNSRVNMATSVIGVRATIEAVRVPVTSSPISPMTSPWPTQAITSQLPGGAGADVSPPRRHAASPTSARTARGGSTTTR